MIRKILHIEMSPNRIYGLDILRAFAILFVMMHHCETMIPSEKFKYLSAFIFDGVGIFFVLSGFLIGGILIKIIQNRKFGFRELFSFWARRWFRTLPNYILVLTLLLTLSGIFRTGFNPLNYADYYVFSQNLFAYHPPFFPEAWSLSVEEWFYIIVPLLLFGLGFFVKIRPKRDLPVLAVVLIVTVTAFRYYRFINLGQTSPEEYGLLFMRQVSTRIDGIMFGLIGAYFAFFHQSVWMRFKLPMLVAGLLLFAFARIVTYGILGDMMTYVFSFTLTSLATLMLLPFLTTVKSGTGLLFRFFTYTSLISYSIYLVNFSLVKFWVINRLDWEILVGRNGYLVIVVKICCFWIFTYLISTVLYKYFEVPMMNVRDRFSKKE
ncbi:acyltransferase [Flavobacterium sp. MAH-1]|uniref:Acyltransferase n=1 Tax=Flavobacterium agri TaxID=2743471 RepID=A0A7Y8Y106_9FLAO|nr:acyltransferase [Flavobacterium agri]NUY80592.1 acyltransferase [Flavobacterium agri]NYA70616.1 acyltransferase [Flavobacterium agri]